MLQRDDIDRLPLVIHFRQRLENRLVPQIVENFVAGFEFLDAFAHAIVGRQQHATQHALLGFGRMRRQPINVWALWPAGFVAPGSL